MRRIFIVGIFILTFSGLVYFLLAEKFKTPVVPVDEVGQINQPTQSEQMEQSAEPPQIEEEPADESAQPTAPNKEKEIVEPIASALARVTKKPFGIKISPSDSPVSPEKFSGYHTGVDFETTEAEQNIAVPIYTICAGKLLVKKQATGYGGVVVQACEINKQAVTVVYGHLNLSSVSAKINQELKAGQRLGVLGQGYSAETDNERKHLHLSIHRGESIVLLGYVSQAARLSEWLDPSQLFIGD